MIFYVFLELKEKIRKCELLLDEQRELLAKANQQIEMNNQEMNKLKEASLSLKNGTKGLNNLDENNDDFEEDDERQMREIVEQFEVYLFIKFSYIFLLKMPIVFNSGIF